MTSVISVDSTDPSASRERAGVTTFWITSAQGDKKIKSCAGTRRRPREPDTPSEGLFKALPMGQTACPDAHTARRTETSELPQHVAMAKLRTSFVVP